MRVLHVCTEVYPLLKTGGLADVAAALPPALVRLGCDSRLLMPGFPALCDGIGKRQTVATLPGRFGAADILLTRGALPNGIEVYLIEAPGLYDRPGNPYADAQDRPYPDNYRRFALLGWMAARLAEGLDAAWRPQVVHGHDWHAGLAPAYLQAARQAGTGRIAGSLLTVHNLAFQGLFPGHVFGELDLPPEFFGIDGAEFYGHVSFLKAGLFYADCITTVSPTYAREIQSAAQGFGLEGLLAHRAGDLHGILNGVDTAVWSPATDPAIAAKYEVASLAGKQQCRAALQSECGLALQQDAPLFGVVSRLTEQKGLNLVLAGVQEIITRGGQLVLLGTGDAALVRAFEDLARAHPASVAVEIGYDETKAHRIIAGSDIILVPSLFEPCGLTQLYGLAYGTLPLVRRVGGLADSVVDCTLENLADDSATGIVFERFEVDAFATAVRRAFALHGRPDDWQQVQRCGMRQSFSWQATAEKLLPLYVQAAGALA